MAFRIAAGCFAILFLLSAAVQWNDPDLGLWIAIYGVAGGLAGAAAAGRAWLLPTAAATAAYAILFITWAPALAHTSWQAFDSVEMKTLEAEEVREAWGLAICLGFAGALLVREWLRRER
jgi:hypothetical protein